MIIDKVSPYITEEDHKRFREIREAQANIPDFIQGDKAGNEAKLAKAMALDEEMKQFKAEIQARYIRAHTKKQLLADIEEIVAAIEKADFLEEIDTYANVVKQLSGGVPEGSLTRLRELSAANFENCYAFIEAQIATQLRGLGGDRECLDRAREIIRRKVSLWYVEQHPAYLPMAHGKPLDELAVMTARNAKRDFLAGTATIVQHEVTLAINRLEELKTTLSPSTDKLLSYSIALFTQKNDFTKPDLERISAKDFDVLRTVTFPLREYAQLLGYDVTERATSTPEEAEAERKRIKNILDNVRKSIKQDLELLQACTLKWSETIRGKARDFASITILDTIAIRNGQIFLTFSPAIARYLAERKLLTQYPTALLRVDARNPTAYNIGRKLAMHYNLDNNQTKGTNNRISIPVLLEWSGLPSYKEVAENDRGHWERRIKEPLEEALCYLMSPIGYLEDWKYTHAKGVELTDEEAAAITSYEDFAKLFLQFTPSQENRVYHADRIAAKQEARAEAKTTKKRKKSKKG